MSARTDPEDFEGYEVGKELRGCEFRKEICSGQEPKIGRTPRSSASDAASGQHSYIAIKDSMSAMPKDFFALSD